MIRPLSGKTDMIVLCEMFPTGFSMNVEKICNREDADATLRWMKRQAVATGAIIAGSMAAAEGDRFYNRFYWICPDGNIGHYDKRHLFIMSDEPQRFTQGTERKQFEWRGWQVKPIVCYDVRFPEWCRNSRSNPYDLMLCVASWPAVRSDAWLTLLKARALENQCFVVGANRVGTDGNGLKHQGNSIVYGPKGEIVGQIPENSEAVATFELSFDELHDFRKKFPVLDSMDVLK